MLFAGDHDAMWQAEIAAKNIAAQYSNVEAVIYPDAGHVFSQDITTFGPVWETMLGGTVDRRLSCLWFLVTTLIRIGEQVCGRFGTSVDVQFGQNNRYIVLDGLFCQAEVLADLSVGFTVGDVVQDAPFGGG